MATFEDYTKSADAAGTPFVVARDAAGDYAAGGALYIEVGGVWTTVDASNPMPVTGPLTDAQLRASAVPVTGTVVATVSGGATEAKQDTQITSLQLLDNIVADTTNPIATGFALCGGVYNVIELPLSDGEKGLLRLRNDRSLWVYEVQSAALAVVGNGTAATAQRVTIASDSTGTVVISDGGGSITIDAVSLPLPAGAATEATLTAISGKLPATLGTKTAANSISVTPASDSEQMLSGNHVSGVTLPLGQGFPSHPLSAIIAGSVAGVAKHIELDSSGKVHITDGGGSITVDGTFWQATQPVSVASLPLPAGAATEATLTAISGKLPASLGVKDSANSISIAPASDSQFMVSFAQPSIWTVAGSGTAVGAQRVEIANNGTGRLSTVGQVDLVATVGGIQDPLPAGTNSIGTVVVTDGGGSITVNGPLTDAELRATPVPVSLSTVAVTNAGTFAVQAAQSGTWTVQPGNTQNTTPWIVNDRPSVSGGLEDYSFLSTAAVQAASIKGSAGQVYSLEFFNVSATPVFVRLYNMSGSPGTGDAANIIWRGVVPGSAAGAGFVKNWDKGLEFSSGIGIRVTGAVADNDNTALAANVIIGNVEWK